MIEVHHLEHSRSQRIIWLLEELGLKVQVNTDQLTKDWGIVKVRSVSSAEGSRVKIGSVVIIGTQK